MRLALVVAGLLLLLSCSDDGPTEADCVAKENEIRRKARLNNVPEDYVCDNPLVQNQVKSDCDAAKKCRADLAAND